MTRLFIPRARSMFGARESLRSHLRDAEFRQLPLFGTSVKPNNIPPGGRVETRSEKGRQKPRAATAVLLVAL